MKLKITVKYRNGVAALYMCQFIGFVKILVNVKLSKKKKKIKTTIVSLLKNFEKLDTKNYIK